MSAVDSNFGLHSHGKQCHQSVFQDEGSAASYQHLPQLYGKRSPWLLHRTHYKHILIRRSNPHVPLATIHPLKPYRARIWANTCSPGIVFVSPASNRRSRSSTMDFISSSVWAMGESVYCSAVMSSTKSSTWRCSQRPNASRLNAGCNLRSAASSTVILYVHICFFLKIRLQKYTYFFILQNIFFSCCEICVFLQSKI